MTTLRTALALTLLAGACTSATTTTTTVSGTPVRVDAPTAVTGTPAPAAAATAASAAADPVGRWTVSLSVQGQSMDMVLELAKLPDGNFGGLITSPAFPPIPVSKAILTGKKLAITVAVPTGEEGKIDVEINGDEMTGEWSMPGDGSKVTARRVK